ncbi:MAG: nucleotide exchange factor GrpE [Nanoarchaeota archaeon]|nr:nucleotide exchange factor GrpE [Nanoarchaeota archaeon]
MKKKTELEVKNEELTIQMKDLTDTLKRVQAEFENYKKRVDKENSTKSRAVKADLIRRMLPIVDSFELAIKNCHEKTDFSKGVEMIFAQVMDFMHGEGLRPINAKGQKFDPHMHEVMLQEKSDNDEIILDELQRGYMLNEQVLRHSKVKIGKKEAEDDIKGHQKGKGT